MPLAPEASRTAATSDTGVSGHTTIVSEESSAATVESARATSIGVSPLGCVESAGRLPQLDDRLHVSRRRTVAERSVQALEQPADRAVVPRTPGQDALNAVC